jgi:DNA-binding response OmpR family regulator
LITRHLKNAGYLTVSTTQSEQVLPLVRVEQPDLIILDIHQPPDPLCGCKIVNALREDSATVQLPVILLASKSADLPPGRELIGPGKIRWCMDVPLDAACYLFKPFSPSELLQLVDQSLLRAVAHSLSTGRAPRLRVLIVNDEPAEAMRLQALMEALGHQVRIASRGTEALEIADADQPHVALVDTGLPDISGLEVLRQLRLNRRTRGAVVILTNPHPRDEDVMFGFRYNSDAHLALPINPLELTTFITRLTEGTDAWDPGRGHSAYWDALWDRERGELGQGEMEE